MDSLVHEDRLRWERAVYWIVRLVQEAIIRIVASQLFGHLECLKFGSNRYTIMQLRVAVQCNAGHEVK